jgi:YhgE/Pip-like protein
MLEALKAYMKKPTTIIGIVTAMMFQVIFSIIWMTGYNGVTDNVNHLKVAIVNQDQGVGKKLTEQLKTSLPFGIEAMSSLEEAKASLDNRDVQMVLHIPVDFTSRLQAPGQKAPLSYFINESNPAMIKSTMQSIASSITAAVNKEATMSGAQVVLQQANVPAQQAQGIAQGLVDKAEATIEYVHPVSGMNNQMLPMMLVLSSFVGAMIMGMNVQQSTMMIGASVSKWNKFGARITINIVSSLFIALLGSTLVLFLGGKTVAGFVPMWLFQALFLLTFMFFSQMFLILFGMAGMLLNIMSLSLQLVSSGAMVPRELLGSFYYRLSEYMPATYAVEGSMNLLFGGPSAWGAAGFLAMIAATCLVIAALGVGLRRESPAPAAKREPIPA